MRIYKIWYCCIVLIFLGCLERTDCLHLERFAAIVDSDTKAYFSHMEYDSVVSDPGIHLEFDFTNNPYCLDKSYKILIYINHQMVYKGLYLENGRLNLPKRYSQGELLNCSIVIISPKFDNKIFIFSSKNTQFWNSNYDKLTMNFITSTDSDERIEFEFTSKAETVDETFTFIDSLNIGIKGKHKIELVQTRTKEDVVHIHFLFYEKKGANWVLRQNFDFEKDEITGPEVGISDFNNDGMNDITMRSAIAARGANEVRRLFIFDKDDGNLVFMKNSEDYPNLRYNKELDCVDAWLVYGGCSTVFLKIERDSLREFARVDLSDDLRTVYLIGTNGKTRMLKQGKTSDDDDLVRYSNYITFTRYE